MYILVLLVAFANNGSSQPVSIASAEFGTQQACEQAGKASVQMTRSVNPNFSGADFRCFPKG